MGHGYLSIVSVVFCQVEVSASGWSLVRRSPTDCGVSEYNREASTMGRPWPTRECCAIQKRRLIRGHGELVSIVWYMERGRTAPRFLNLGSNLRRVLSVSIA